MLPQIVFTAKGFQSKSKDVAVVTFANGTYTRYIPQFKHYIQSTNPLIPHYVFTDFAEIDSPPHNENPYAFKWYAIETVRKMGYRFVLWCDSVLKSVTPVEQLLPEIAERGVYLAEDGWKTGQFANDRALEYFGVTRDEAMNISSIWACFMGFDFANPRTHEYFAKLKAACDAGIFRGRHWNTEHTESQDPRCKGHRHDQTCAELISYQMKIPRGTHVVTPDPNSTHRYFIGREW